ncbi:MAG: bifunctional DNA-formamidopyrimidine glycosylase/DNA-(apurinic or apyrimidinic site) lyase, partial [Nocardioides sp.]|nr:bifunctional DNA-formamidopyrimidine glycosylase/DNA-(apurinic or apyrimidinic site) lyase [Nocardioides sp.]
MPELPEVEVVRAGLQAHVPGRTIEAVELLHARPVRRDPRGSTGFAAALVGQRIESVRRRGKYFWIALDNGDALLGHLGMSGQMLLQHPGAADERHLRVRFTLSAREQGRPQASPPLEMRFVDQRMFGGLLVSQGGAVLPTEIAHIARDPLDPEFDEADFVRRARRRTSAVKRLLLDQGLVSGVGNIYADEALWRAGIHGERPGDRLTGPQLRTVLGHARAVMEEALAQGGTSFDALYVNVNG